MAVTQISRIQHRRGLQQDLPQLTAAELGWSVDTRQLYIGNGTLAEGAPSVGITRILTEHDITDLTSNTAFGSYTFVGNAAGYTAQTGASVLSPVVRSFQQKFDDVVNIRDFGALGDNNTDDTDAINRALQQIYKSTISPTDTRARRTIYFPGGTYVISNPILIPPYAKLIGDGIGSVIIRQTQGNKTVANLCDSSFQTGTSIGTSSAIKPQDIEISGIHFLNSNSSTNRPIFVIDSASNVKIQSCKFQANAVGFYPNIVSVETSVETTSKVTFDSCQFTQGGNGISIFGTGVSLIRVFNSDFDNLSNVAVHLNDSNNFLSVGNYLGAVGGSFLTNGNNSNFSIGDFDAVNSLTTGIFLGNFIIGTSQQYTITNAPLVLTPILNTTAKINYEIRDGANVRFGTFTFTKTSSTLNYNDDYIETETGLLANLSANNDSILASVSTGSAIFKFSSQSFN
jgi:hypothetical protein